MKEAQTIGCLKLLKTFVSDWHQSASLSSLFVVLVCALALLHALKIQDLFQEIKVVFFWLAGGELTGALKPKLKSFHGPCLACVARGWRLSGISYPTAASVVWSPAFWEGISLVLTTFLLQKSCSKHPWLVCYSKHAIKSVKKFQAEPPRICGSAGDSCSGKLNQEEEWSQSEEPEQRNKMFPKNLNISDFI